MAKKDYAELEQHIINVMNDTWRFTYNNKEFDVLMAGKPRPQGSGECKTDVYIRLMEVQRRKELEIKISVKTEGVQEFQENKVSAERAEAILGPDWQTIIYRTAKKMEARFDLRRLLFAESCGNIKKNSMTLGWKLEIASKQRDLSAKIDLTDREIRDYIYKGTNQSSAKKNALVNGKLIENSGVAEYLLVTTADQIRSPRDVLAQMKLIDNATIDDTYLIFTGNNYCIDTGSADGARPLAVRVDWKVTGLFKKKLTAQLCFDNPLSFTGGGDMMPIAKQVLQKLGARKIEDLLPFLEDPEIYYPPLS